MGYNSQLAQFNTKKQEGNSYRGLVYSQQRDSINTYDVCLCAKSSQSPESDVTLFGQRIHRTMAWFMHIFFL